MTTYRSTKTYGNERGFSCAFRQWRADSHCNLVHGYSLGFRFVFEAQQLDERNWVYDFGDCDWIKDFLQQTFDHTLAIAADDPQLALFQNLHQAGVCNLVVMADGVGCERFAETVYRFVSAGVATRTAQRVRVVSVEVFEHGSNSALYCA